MISYLEDSETERKIHELIEKLELNHIDKTRLRCFRSHGSDSRRVVARCYALSKIWQKALKTDAHYIIEILSEKFDKLNEEEKTKVLIHELMHIPQTFGGGFRHHDFVCRKNVEQLYKRLKSVRYP